jgi:hypothetical protein
MQCNRSITKPQGNDFFFIISRFHLIWVAEVWLLRIADLWECIKVFHERQISVMPRFCVGGVSTYKIFKGNYMGDKSS